MPSPPIKNESLELIDALFKEEADLDDDEYRPATKKARGGSGDKRKRAGVKGRAWTPDERVKLFEAKLAGMKGPALEAALPGRSAHQCETTWGNTVKPMIIRGLREGKPAKK